MLQSNKCGLVGLLETRVKSSVLNKVAAIFCNNWSVVTNNSSHPRGRIWVLWKPTEFCVNILSSSPQWIHCECTFKPGNMVFYMTVVYGFNTLAERGPLWTGLRGVKTDKPWLVVGDFNNILYPNERLGAPVHLFELTAFQQCVLDCNLKDMKAVGRLFTWTNKQEGLKKVMTKIDRVMINDDWLDVFESSYVEFLAEGTFDHSPSLIHLLGNRGKGSKPFKFYNMWFLVPEFFQVVQQGWQWQCHGVPMYQVVQRLRGLKQPLKRLNASLFYDIENKTNIAIQLLNDLQSKVMLDPHNILLVDLEREANGVCRMLMSARDSYLIQRAKIDWVQNADENSGYYHRIIRARRVANSVIQIIDAEGILHTEKADIEDAFLSFYKDHLGSSRPIQEINGDIVNSGRLISDCQRETLLAPVSGAEIKEAIFSIPDTKAPGPDGFSSAFFKKSWEIIREDVIGAVKDFFLTGRMLKQLNATILTLIPKCATPRSVKEFRPIACCNVVYKCISKIL
ncbi:hypothetical protein vseg_001800 [Gypsophila vaccaria]